MKPTDKRAKHMASIQLDPGEVDVEELIRAVKEMMVDKFAGRKLRWEVAEKALAITSFELKQMALFGPPTKP